MRATGLWTTLMALLVGAGAWGELAECQLTEGPLDPPMCGPHSHGAERTRPAKIVGLPALKAENPHYFVLALPALAPQGLGDRIAAVLDQSDGETYDILYVDTDGDFDLADEQPLRGEEAASPALDLIFPAVEVKAPDRADVPPARLRLASSRLAGRRRPRLHTVADRAWFGEAPIDGRPTKIALIDIDLNGRPDLARDKVWLDENRDEEIDENREVRQLSKAVFVEGELLGLDAGDSLDTLVIGPYEGPRGRLSVVATDGNGREMDVTSVWLVGKEIGGLSGRAVGDAVEVPSARYERMGVGAEFADANGQPASVQLTHSVPVAVDEGRTTQVAIGGPTRLGIHVESHQADNGTLLAIRLRLTTESGATITGISCGTESRPTGKIRAKRPDGTVLREEQAARDLGQEGAWTAFVRIPRAEPAGEYTIEATLDLAPYQTEKLEVEEIVTITG